MLESNHLYVGAKHATEDKARHPSDVAFPTAADIGREVAKALLVPNGNKRYVRQSMSLLITGSAYILGGPGKLYSLAFVFDQVANSTGGAAAMYTITDGNFDTIYECPISVIGQVSGNLQSAFSLKDGIAFARGLKGTLTILNGTFSTGSISALIVYESIAIGQREC